MTLKKHAGNVHQKLVLDLFLILVNKAKQILLKIRYFERAYFILSLGPVDGQDY